MSIVNILGLRDSHFLFAFFPQSDRHIILASSTLIPPTPPVGGAVDAEIKAPSLLGIHLSKIMSAKLEVGQITALHERTSLTSRPPFD